jgi:hypothetical protein
MASAAAPAEADARARFTAKLPRAGEITVAHVDINLRRAAPRRVRRVRLLRRAPRGVAVVARARRTGRRRISVDAVIARRRSRSRAAGEGRIPDDILLGVEHALIPEFAVRARQAQNALDRNRWVPAIGIGFRPPFNPQWRFLAGAGTVGLAARQIGEGGLAAAADLPSQELDSLATRLGGTNCSGAWFAFSNQDNAAGLQWRCSVGASAFNINTFEKGITGFFPNNLPCEIATGGGSLQCNHAFQPNNDSQIVLQFSQPIGYGGRFSLFRPQGTGFPIRSFYMLPPIPPSQDPCDGAFWRVPGAPGVYQYRFDCRQPITQFRLDFGGGNRDGVRGFLDPPGFDCVPSESPFARFIEELVCRSRTGADVVAGNLYQPSDPVTREQLAVFLARAFDPGFTNFSLERR